MAASSFDARAAALALRSVESGDGFVPLFTEQYSRLDWHQARAIARARDDLRRRDGETHIGYKLGWTSIAMREALGIEQPNWGTLWDTHQLTGTLDRTRFRHPKIEPELVYIAGDHLGADVTVETVCSSAAGWSVGLEVVDPRFDGYDFDWLDNTADNSSAGGIITASSSSLPDADPATWTVAFDDGRSRSSGRGEVVMGSPAVAVAWLARRLAEEGDAIEPGMMVFTGGVTAPFDAVPGTEYAAGCDDLDVRVSLRVV